MKVCWNWRRSFATSIGTLLLGLLCGAGYIELRAGYDRLRENPGSGDDPNGAFCRAACGDGTHNTRRRSCVIASSHLLPAPLKSRRLRALTAFLARYPRSGWAPALLTNLGISYLHDGYFSRALDAWSGLARGQGRHRAACQGARRPCGRRARAAPCLARPIRGSDGSSTRSAAGRSPAPRPKRCRPPAKSSPFTKTPAIFTCGPLALRPCCWRRGATRR